MANPFRWTSGKNTNETNTNKDLFSAVFSTESSPRIIDEDDALKIPSVRAATELISNSISQLPIYLYTEDENKSIKQLSDTRVSMLNDEANRYETGQLLKKKIVQDFLFYGVSYLYEKNGNLHYLKAENMVERTFSENGFTPTRKSFEYTGTKFVTFDENEILVRDTISKLGGKLENELLSCR